MGLFLCPEGGVSHGIPQGFLSGADLVHPPLQVPSSTQEGGQTCQVNPNAHALTLAVPS